MSNLKKLLAVIVTVCILATMTVPAFAAASEAEICAALGILKGDSSAGVTDEYLAKDTQRFQAAILYLRLIGKEEEAKAFTGEENFDDAAEIYAGGQRILAYLKANPDLGWIGIGGNKFDPTSTITAQMIYKVLLEALGYKQDVDFIYAEVLEKAAEVGLSKIADVEGLTNADMAVAIVEALTLKMKDSDKTLIEKLIEDGLVDEETAAEYGLVELVPPTLEVVSVSADNLKEVVVVFNQPVDGDTVNKDNIKVDGKDGSVSLKDDKVTVVITIDDNGLDNQTEYKLVVSGVKSADGTEIEKTEIKFKAFDATLPVAEKITVTGPKNFTITFSEPIKVGGEVEVKSGTEVIGVNPSFGVGGREVTVDLYSSMTDGKTYEVTVKNFEDYAGYKNVIKTFDLAYAKDTSAPVATVEKVDQKYVKVKFNKPVTGLVKEMFYHTFTAWTALEIYESDDFDPENAIGYADSVDTVWVEFAKDATTGKPLAEGQTIFGILGKVEVSGTTYEIKDNWDNKFETTEFKITVNVDRIAPEVAELTVDTESSLKIKFSEDVVFNENNVEVTDADGKSIDGVSVSVSGSGKEYTINLGTGLAGKTIVVKIKDVTDTALQANRMAVYTATLTITDKSAPTVSKVTKKVSEKALYVFFNEAVDNTALDKANYAFINPTTYSLTLISKDPVFFDGNKVVKIQLTDDEWTNLNDSNLGLFVQRVKDLAGNAMSGQTKLYSEILAHDADSNKPYIDKIEVVAADKVVVTFTQYLKRVDRGAFAVNGATPAAMEYTTNSDGNTVVTLKPASGHEFAPDLNDAELVVDVSGSYKLLNIFDVEAKNETKSASAMVDKIAPSLAKDSSGKYDVTVSGTTVTIKFNEAIDDGALSTRTFEVKDNTVDRIVSNDTDTVTLTLRNEVTAGTEVSITQKLPVYDLKGNEFKHSDTIKVTAQ